MGWSFNWIGHSPAKTITQVRVLVIPKKSLDFFLMLIAILCLSLIVLMILVQERFFKDKANSKIKAKNKK